jgi:Glycosyl hydrolases family 16
MRTSWLSAAALASLLGCGGEVTGGAGTDSMSEDIRPRCGDGICQTNKESCSSCPQDCGMCVDASCTPTTCAAQGKNCGSISDGCGGTLSCGSCASPETCGGGGVANVCGGGSTPMPVGVPGAWTLVFDDEFNGTSLDTTKWDPHWYQEGGVMNNVGTYAANVSVSGGYLIMTLASSTSGAMITTESNHGFAVQVGMYAEARVYLPGNGTKIYNWSGWWVSGPPWPSGGEHDIVEVLSGDATVNYHSPSGAHNQGAVPGYWGDAFHTYGLYRKAASADVYWDGVLVKSYPTDDNGSGEYLDLTVGYSSSYPAYGTTGQMKVDYVRVWR